MPASRALLAKRMLVATLLAIAGAQGILLDVRRESADKAVLKACEKLAKTLGRTRAAAEEQQQLKDAKEAWQTTLKGNRAGGRRKLSVSNAPQEQKRKRFRFQGHAVMLTFQSWHH